jgi:poly(A) polymerase Pap1
MVEQARDENLLKISGLLDSLVKVLIKKLEILLRTYLRIIL